MSDKYDAHGVMTREDELRRWEVILLSASGAGMTAADLGRLLALCDTVAEVGSALSGHNLVLMAQEKEAFK